METMLFGLKINCIEWFTHCTESPSCQRDNRSSSEIFADLNQCQFTESPFRIQSKQTHRRNSTIDRRKFHNWWFVWVGPSSVGRQDDLWWNRTILSPSHYVEHPFLSESLIGIHILRLHAVNVYESPTTFSEWHKTWWRWTWLRSYHRPCQSLRIHRPFVEISPRQSAGLWWIVPYIVIVCFGGQI
jgi:hypothetical protein